MIKKQLIDCFVDLFRTVEQFRKTAGENQPSYDSVRSEILRILKLSEDFPAKGYSSPEDFDQARYAVCAWIDESILGSAWNYKGRWRQEFLQRLYYNSADAGEKFFERLNMLGAHQNNIREVFYLCLTLGFKGRYFGPDNQFALEQLKRRQLQLLFDGGLESPSIPSFEQHKLFPQAYPLEAIKKPAPEKSTQRQFFLWVTIGGPVLFCLVLFLAFKLTLHSLGENILKAMH